ncbi:MAG: SufD family Fe-S cluster assembly protein [Bacteroidales bacterium]|nr:SufD family Fe-S cluster assembly protein [Bacteroidales bacterium]
MIRKDQLPDIWGDDWRIPSSDKPLVLKVHDGSKERRLLTDDAWIYDHLGNDVLCGPLAPLIELCIPENTDYELYVVHGIKTPSRFLSDINVTMHSGSHLTLGIYTLGGQHVRTNVVVRMEGEGCVLDASGLYLMDREQQCDNYIFVEHAKPHCVSHTLYKGILDDAARARFNGHVLVQDGAVKTEALQTNRNILLTDKAHVDTRPFLEIYNDDVKCSHGSTIGQLDEQAKFYLQTRGISERTAVTMLSYAFCDEVIRGIAVEPLREMVSDMVKKRLHGELTSSCDDCAIKCSSPCNGPDVNFRIDPDKL